MGQFTKIPQDTFSGLQTDAGVLLTDFDPANPAVVDENILCATTGGIQASCTPTYSDYGEDVDNAPANVKELKHHDGWDCKMSTTSLGTSPRLIQWSLGAADIDANDASHVVPRRQLSQDDFKDLWWVGDRADGGLVAVHLMNALSTGGFSLQTTKNGKGNISIEITGHVSIDAQDVVPMEFYSKGPDAGSVSLNTHHTTVAEGESVTLKATVIPYDATVTWASDDNDKATVTAGVVEGVAAGTVTITASITEDGHTYKDTCTVVITE